MPGVLSFDSPGTVVKNSKADRANRTTVTNLE